MWNEWYKFSAAICFLFCSSARVIGKFMKWDYAPCVLYVFIMLQRLFISQRVQIIMEVTELRHMMHVPALCRDWKCKYNMLWWCNIGWLSLSVLGMALQHYIDAPVQFKSPEEWSSHIMKQITVMQVLEFVVSLLGTTVMASLGFHSVITGRSLTNHTV